MPVDSDKSTRTARNIGVGCFTFFIGGVSGAMTAVLLGKFVGFFTRAPQCSEMPVCDWHLYALGGFIVGAVTLPALVITRLVRADDRSDRATGDTSNRG